MNIRNVIERLRKVYLDEHSEDYTKCELMENILRGYQRKIEDRLNIKFENGFFNYSIHNTRTIIRKRINAIADILNNRIEGLLDNPNINLFVCYEENQFYVEFKIGVDCVGAVFKIVRLALQFSAPNT